MKSLAHQWERMRAHDVFLGERRYSIDQIADIYQVDHDRVSLWLDWREEYNFDGPSWRGYVLNLSWPLANSISGIST